MESQMPKKHSILRRKCFQEKGSSSVTVDVFWVWWEMKNDDSPLMQRTKEMNSTLNLEETFGGCPKQWPEHKNMNFEPLYTS